VIGLCGVSSDKYSKSYGNKFTNQPWRERGLLSFLLRVCQKIHRTIFNYDQLVLHTNVSLTGRYPCLKAFQKIGFSASAYSFNNGDQKLSTLFQRSSSLEFVPYLAEGCVYSLTGGH